MSLNPTFESTVSQKRSLSSVLAGRVVKRPKAEDGPRLQEAAIQLMGQQANLCSLLREAGEKENKDESQKEFKDVLPVITGKLLAKELRQEAAHLGVSAAALSVKTVLGRLIEVTKDEKRGEMLTAAQRVQLSVLLESCRELLCQGVLCPKLLWQEFRREQRLPKLELVYHLHLFNVISLKHIVESDEDFRSWSVSQLQSLCGWTPRQEEEEEDQDSKQTQQRVLLTVVGVLVGAAFDGAASEQKTSLLCCSVLDDMLYWLLDRIEDESTSHSAELQSKKWIQMYDTSLCGISVSPEALQHFFTHSLTQSLTYKPRLTVSDAVSLQSKWTFAKASNLLTSLYRKLAVSFSVEQLLCHMQKVLETHEVNWKHVLCFCSTLLVYYQSAQSKLRELLSKLLSAAFEGYDLESMITSFLLARQGGLEGPAIFPCYSDWFKMTFGGSTGCHTSSKKSLVFLLKFLSDLVPFEPPQYLKVHILHPPYVPVKHRTLLMEYISLAKTRLSDLKESVEDMGLYEDVSAEGAAGQCQAVQDVEKAVALFEATGRVSATVMEASIFRRPYFLNRFLAALLEPRMLPLKADTRMNFIEALKKAEKIPAAQYSTYMELCQKQRQQTGSTVYSDPVENPLEVLKVQLQEFTGLVLDGECEEMSAQLSRILYTVRVCFHDDTDEQTGQTVIRLQVDIPLSTELHVKVSNLILRTFCQCILDTSQVNPPNRQKLWASRFVSSLLCNAKLLSSILHRLWDLFYNQASSLSPAHVLGLGAFLVHLQASMSKSPFIQLVPPFCPTPVTMVEAVSSALVCRTRCEMLFCLRACSVAVCYGICRGDGIPEQDYIPCCILKKLLYLIPRLLPEARRTSAETSTSDHQVEHPSYLWSSITAADSTWRKMAWMLWTHSSFQKLKDRPQCQLYFSEWLDNELRVHRGEDALSDFERQEYQTWACTELYLNRPEEQGGCGGDLRNLCSHLLNSILDHQSRVETRGRAERGSCQPDILSRLQEAVYEMEVCGLSFDLCDLFFEVVSQRCSDTASPAISSQLSLQRTLQTWNSVMLSLPAAVMFKVKTERGKRSVDWDNVIQHVNQHQRKVCNPVGLLPYQMTVHLLKGLLYVAARCDHPAEEMNRAWTHISVSCPLLMVSTAHWWQPLSTVLSGTWHRLSAGDSLPEQLQLVASSERWACSLEEDDQWHLPPAVPLLLAACLHRVWRGRTEHSFSRALKSLRPEREAKHKEVLICLFILCVNDFLSTLLYPQEKSQGEEMLWCSELLNVLVDSPDWLCVFTSGGDCGVYKPVSMVTPDDFTRLKPWAFCNLLPRQSEQLQQRALCCAGFLHTAVSCYIDALQLFLDGQTPLTSVAGSEKQTELSHVLSQTKELILRAVSQAPTTALSSSQFRQLESRCTDVDVEVGAALSMHFDPPSLSPEMDFL